LVGPFNTHWDDGELHLIGDVELALFQHLAEVEEHARVAVHTLDEAESVAHGGNHTLERHGTRPETGVSIGVHGRDTGLQ